MKKLLAVTLLIFFCMPAVCALNSKEEKNVYKSFDNSEMNIALTFDDGPHPRLTPQILDILNKYGVKATFFVVGSNVKAYPDVVKRVLDDGHELGNHTENHINLEKSNSRNVIKELKDSHDDVLELCDFNMKYFRPPMGAVNKTVCQIAKKMDYDVILWSIDTEDWRHLSVDKITDNIYKNIKSGSIILFHDYISNGSPTPEAIDIIIPQLQEKGYNFVTIGQLLESK